MNKNILITIVVIASMLSIAFIILNKPSQVNETYDTIVMYRNGEFKKAKVIKFGVYCTASWYSYATDNVYLKSNGTATNGPWDYKWTLLEFNSEQDKLWYNKNCKEIN